MNGFPRIPGKVHYLWFTSRDRTTQVPFSLGGSAAVEIYSGAGGTTQFTTGVTLVVDYDGVVGYNRLALDMADATAYPVGEDFAAKMSAGTVNGNSIVGEVIANFNTRVRDLGIVQAGVPAAGSTTSKVVMPAGRIAGISAGDNVWVEGGQKRPVNNITTTTNANDTLNFTQALPADPTGGFVRVTAAALADPAAPLPASIYGALGTLVTEGGSGRLAAALTHLLDVAAPAMTAASVDQSGDSFARLGAPAGASHAADIAAVAAKTVNLPTDPADQSLIIAATDAVMTRLGAPAGASVSADLAAVLVSAGAALTLAALETRDGILTGAVATDAGNAETSFKVSVDVGTDIRFGMLRLTSGALAGESRLVYWTGTQVTMFGHASMPAAGKRFSAVPADAVTFRFRPGA